MSTWRSLHEIVGTMLSTMTVSPEDPSPHTKES